MFQPPVIRRTGKDNVHPPCQRAFPSCLAFPCSAQPMAPLFFASYPCIHFGAESTPPPNVILLTENRSHPTFETPDPQLIGARESALGPAIWDGLEAEA